MPQTTDLLNIRPLRQRLKEGKEALGMWLGITDALAVEAIAADCDLDWVLLDMEHGGAGWDDLKQVMLGWKWSNIPLIVRPPSHDPKFLMASLDLGVSGFVVPFVNTAEDAMRIADACRYPPMGNRGSAPRRVSRHYTLTEEYAANANDDVFVMVQIEHKTAVENVEEIAKVKGIDALFIGPGDMSFSYGIFGEMENPIMVNAIQKVVDTGKANGLPVAMAVDTTPELIHQRIAQGIQLVTVGLDWMFMRNAIKAQTAGVRKLL
jgi:2-keto-3-deoxy-L-rhamnonate aldolase RhmA